MKEYKSMKGVSIDLGKLMAQSEKSITVGNTRTNARGDQLGRAGRVIKGADEIAREHYNRNNPNAVKKTTLKVDDIQKDMDDKLAQARAAAEQATEDDWSDPVVTPAKPEEPASTEAVEEAVDIVQAAEAKAAEESSETEEDEWVEDDEGNFVRKSELEEAKNEPVSKSKKSRKK